MEEVGVNVVCERNIFSKWLRSVSEFFLFDVTIDGVCPVEVLLRKTRIIRFVGPNADNGELHLG